MAAAEAAPGKVVHPRPRHQVMAVAAVDPTLDTALAMAAVRFAAVRDRVATRGPAHASVATQATRPPDHTALQPFNIAAATFAKAPHHTTAPAPTSTGTAGATPGLLASRSGSMTATTTAIAAG